MKKLSICQRNKNLGSKIWYLRTFNTETHRTTYKSLHTSIKYKAEQILDKEKQKIFLSPDREKLENLPPLKKLYTNWINYISSNFTQGTTDVYKSKFKEFFDFCDTNKIVFFPSFTAVHANEILNNPNLKASTKRHKKAIYLAFFNWVLSTYDINEKNVFRTKPKKIPQWGNGMKKNDLKKMTQFCKNEKIPLFFITDFIKYQNAKQWRINANKIKSCTTIFKKWALFRKQRLINNNKWHGETISNWDLTPATARGYQNLILEENENKINNLFTKLALHQTMTKEEKELSEKLGLFKNLYDIRNEQ